MLTEIFIVLIYFCVVFFIAFKSKRGSSKNVEDQYLAGKSISTFESISSIIATEVSALTFIGIPAFSFGMDFRFIFVYVGAIFGRFVLAKVFLPKLYGKDVTIYSTATSNVSNGDLIKKILSGIYIISKILAVGVRLYSGSILVSGFFNVSIYTGIIIISVITSLYTLIGGLKAVIRTDILQAFVFISGGLAAHYIIPSVSGGSWWDMMSLGVQNSKIISFDWGYLPVILTGVLGGFLFDICTHGVDQDFAQRLLANKSLKGAQRAIFLSSFFSIFVGLIFLGIGTLLWSYHQSIPFNLKGDYVFSDFILKHFPPYLRGFMLAGVVAATMSTLDSTINAISSCFSQDLFTDRDQNKVKKYFKWDAVIVSALLVLVAFIASQSSGLLTLGLKVASWSGGYLLGSISFLIFTRKPITPIHFIIAYILNLFVIYLATTYLKTTWHWNVYFGFIITLIYEIVPTVTKGGGNSRE